MEGTEPIPTPDRPAPEDWLQAAQADIGVATIVTDARGRVTFTNPSVPRPV